MKTLPRKTAHWITGSISTPAGPIPRISARLTLRDICGSWAVRWGIGRMGYTVAPGLYAAGTPDDSSPVLVSANYKLSFDALRRELSGLNLWILVLDTRGVNVWCAAGKGTFGTTELVSRIEQTDLESVVSHRKLILPQLGAPGIASHEVPGRSGFRVVFGPVRARDIPAFLAAGMKATPEMRRVRFGAGSRAVLVPMELRALLKPALIGLACVLAFTAFRGPDATVRSLFTGTLSGFLPFLGAGLAGAALTPLLLPVIPGRALSLKGWIAGLAWAAVCVILFRPALSGSAFFLLALPPLASFTALNFTGATVYTSLSGVVREMRYSIPAMIASAAAGSAVGAAGMLFGF